MDYIDMEYNCCGGTTVLFLSLGSYSFHLARITCAGHPSNCLLFVVFEFHDKRLYVLSLALPFLDALFGIRVEVLLLLVEERLRTESGILVFLKCFDVCVILLLGLVLVEIGQFLGADALFFLFLLLSQLELFIAGSPEFCELLFFLLGHVLLLDVSCTLQLTTAFNGQFHLQLAALLLFEESVGLVLSFLHLLVQHLVFVVLDGTELTNLLVNHLLTVSLLCCESRVLALLFHQVTGGLLFCELLNSLFLIELSAASLLLLPHLLFIGLDQFLLHLHGALLTGHLAGLFALKVLVSLTFDEFTFEHLALQVLDVLKFELFKLVGDALCVVNFVFIFLLQLGLHLDVVLGHLGLFHLIKLKIDVFLDGLLALCQLLLCDLLVSDVTHHHFRLQGFDLVLRFVHVLVGVGDHGVA